MPLKIERGSRDYWLLMAGLFLGGVGLVLVLPYLVGTVAGIDLLSQIAAYSVALLGLILLMGYCGQISLAHSAFVGLGGYTTVILASDYGWPYLATIPVAIVLSLVVGALIGIPALRIRGLYLAAVTLAVAALFPPLVISLEKFTEGTSGKFAREAMAAPTWFFVNPYTREGPPTVRFYVIAAIAAVMFLIAVLILRSRIGRAMVALRDAPLAASASGVQVARTKIFAFAISGAYGGVAGSLLAIQLPQASDTRYTLDLAIFLLVALVAGGSGTLLGAIPGAIIFITLRSFIGDWASALPIFASRDGGQIVGVISGLLLLAIVFLMPGGLADGLKKLGGKIVKFTDPVPRNWQRYQFPATLRVAFSDTPAPDQLAASSTAPEQLAASSTAPDQLAASSTTSSGTTKG